MNQLDQLASLFERTQDELRKYAVRAVDSSLVVRNWLFGWYLVEFENANAGRAELYGKKPIETLANQLKQRGLKGCSCARQPLTRPEARVPPRSFALMSGF